MNFSPLSFWKKGEPLTAQKLNEPIARLRGGNVSFTGGETRQLPSGTVLSIPPIPGLREGFVARIHDQGPGGESDFSAETYWAWVEYFVADLWGNTVDIADTYPTIGSDLTDTIIPVTNLCERQPGGPPDNGTHNLPLGFPIFILPMFGRAASATDRRPVQRWVTFTPPGPGVGQYKYMYYGMVTQNKAGWDYIRANPMPGT